MTQIFRFLPAATGEHPVQGHDATLYAALKDFPSALVVVNRTGHTVLANHSLCTRYGKVTVEPRSVDRILSGLGGECRIKLRCDLQNTTVEVHALAVALRDEYLLVIGDATDSPGNDEVTRLRTLVHSLELASSTDHLTGAWNRAHFDRLISAELERSVSLLHPLSLVLLDIDHFKRINDEHGHLAGDFVLREVVHVFRAQLRRSDELFRWGGEEFAVLPGGCGYRAAERSAEKIRQAIEVHTFSCAGKITLSAGVAEYRTGESPSAWFHRLDKALYTAKSGGRNRVVVDRSGNSDDWAAAGQKLTMHLQWSEAYECGESTIDEQHRELFTLANATLDATLNHDEGALQQLERFIHHVQEHFADEEALLAKVGYPELERHRRIHAGLLQEATRLHQRTVEGSSTLGELVEFLGTHVVARHLMVADRQFFPWILNSRSRTGLLPVSQTPGLGLMMKPEVANGKATVQEGVQA